MPVDIVENIRNINNLEVVYADISQDFITKLSSVSKVMLLSKIGDTNSETYKEIRSIVKKQNKEIVADVLV